MKNNSHYLGSPNSHLCFILEKRLSFLLTFNDQNQKYCKNHCLLFVDKLALNVILL